MNILVLNGSPKGEKSHTLKLTTAFLAGLNTGHRHVVQTIAIAKERIEPCLGCYSCWTKTPGNCVMDDNMAELLPRYIEADLIIWSFPLYYFSMPSKIKGFMDRLLPLNLPIITATENGRGSHPSRYDLAHQRHILISTCGFHATQGNYDALIRQFEIVFGDRLTKILCPEGELFGVPYLATRTNEYLSHVKKAGSEFISKGSFSPETQDKLNVPLYPPEVFVEMANASWDIEKTPTAQAARTVDQSHRFMRQMAATYNPASYTKDIVLEMEFTDIGKTYQLSLGKERCAVKTDDFAPYTTRIETPFETWLSISEGKISGAEAMMKRQYKVAGEFGTMLKMDEYFRAGNPETAATAPTSGGLKSPNMLLLLLPFMALWVFLPIDGRMGGVAGIIASAVVAVLHGWWKPVFYERIGALSVTLIGLYALVSGGVTGQIALPFFAFGLMWTVSSLLKIPLTAYYSCKGYGGETAFDNPLFIKTNRILTAMWGLTYLMLGVATLAYAETAHVPYWAIITNIPTALLGAFTVWFSRWYPAHVAGGGNWRG